MLTESTARNLPAIWLAFADAQTQVCIDWLALTQETWVRCAPTRSPLEYMSIASLMLPEYVSSAMRYGKNVSDLVAACRELAGGITPRPDTALAGSAPADVVGSASVAPTAPDYAKRSPTPRVPPEIPSGGPQTRPSPPLRMDGRE
jgi:hypothetical protein